MNEEHIKNIQKEYVDGEINEVELEERIDKTIRNGYDVKQQDVIEQIRHIILKKEKRPEKIFLSPDWYHELLNSTNFLPVHSEDAEGLIFGVPIEVSHNIDEYRVER
ncbi:MAG: hypothetical protein J07AB43_00330 [Candidatus Nanosalina sp. J07AB43]|jgi:hypothetical protein|nr:MAG: hypothetical protein J07AB43_00330 [Candidatus Nanosalina sp. J07AB43]